jgi:hypothetical protein
MASLCAGGRTECVRALLDYGVYKARIEPLFLEKRPGHARCVTCHAGSTTLRLQVLPAGASTWTDDQSRQNFDAIKTLVVPGNPAASRLLRHPLAPSAGGDVFHGGGRHWTSQSDPEWQVLASWVNGETLASRNEPPVARIIQTNAAGDNIHVIDPATNEVVGTINDIEVPHGVAGAPDGSRVYFTDESRETVDVVRREDVRRHQAHSRSAAGRTTSPLAATARASTRASRRRQAPWTSSIRQP